MDMKMGVWIRNDIWDGDSVILDGDSAFCKVGLFLSLLVRTSQICDQRKLLRSADVT